MEGCAEDAAWWGAGCVLNSAEAKSSTKAPVICHSVAPSRWRLAGWARVM